jgi:hypothetical protein
MFSFGILDVGDVAQQHRRAVAIGDDQIAIRRGLVDLVVGGDLEALVALIDMALGAVGVGRADRGAHVLQADAVAVELDRAAVRRAPTAVRCRPA